MESPQHRVSNKYAWFLERQAPYRGMYDTIQELAFELRAGLQPGIPDARERLAAYDKIAQLLRPLLLLEEDLMQLIDEQERREKREKEGNLSEEELTRRRESRERSRRRFAAFTRGEPDPFPEEAMARRRELEKSHMTAQSNLSKVHSTLEELAASVRRNPERTSGDRTLLNRYEEMSEVILDWHDSLHYNALDPLDD